VAVWVFGDAFARVCSLNGSQYAAAKSMLRAPIKNTPYKWATNQNNSNYVSFSYTVIVSTPSSLPNRHNRLSPSSWTTPSVFLRSSKTISLPFLSFRLSWSLYLPC
jgi:hypothetical protein